MNEIEIKMPDRSEPVVAKVSPSKPRRIINDHVQHQRERSGWSLLLGSEQDLDEFLASADQNKTYNQLMKLIEQETNAAAVLPRALKYSELNLDTDRKLDLRSSGSYVLQFSQTGLVSILQTSSYLQSVSSKGLLFKTAYFPKCHPKLSQKQAFKERHTKMLLKFLELNINSNQDVSFPELPLELEPIKRVAEDLLVHRSIEEVIVPINWGFESNELNAKFVGHEKNCGGGYDS